MTKKKTEPATQPLPEIEEELKKLLLTVLKEANAPGVALDARTDALKTGSDTYAKLMKLPPSGDERKGGFNVFKAASGGTGGSGGGPDSGGFAVGVLGATRSDTGR